MLSCFLHYQINRTIDSWKSTQAETNGRERVADLTKKNIHIKGLWKKKNSLSPKNLTMKLNFIHCFSFREEWNYLNPYLNYQTGELFGVACYKVIKVQHTFTPAGRRMLDCSQKNPMCSVRSVGFNYIMSHVKWP